MRGYGQVQSGGGDEGEGEGDGQGTGWGQGQVGWGGVGMITRERLVPLKIEDEGGQRIGGQVAQCEEKAPANSKYEPCSFRLFCFPFPPDPFL